MKSHRLGSESSSKVQPAAEQRERRERGERHVEEGDRERKERRRERERDKVERDVQLVRNQTYRVV